MRVEDGPATGRGRCYRKPPHGTVKARALKADWRSTPKGSASPRPLLRIYDDEGEVFPRSRLPGGYLPPAGSGGPRCSCVSSSYSLPRRRAPPPGAAEGGALRLRCTCRERKGPSRSRSMPSLDASGETRIPKQAPTAKKRSSLLICGASSKGKKEEDALSRRASGHLIRNSISWLSHGLQKVLSAGSAFHLDRGGADPPKRKREDEGVSLNGVRWTSDILVGQSRSSSESTSPSSGAPQRAAPFSEGEERGGEEASEVYYMVRVIEEDARVALDSLEAARGTGLDADEGFDTWDDSESALSAAEDVTVTCSSSYVSPGGERPRVSVTPSFIVVDGAPDLVAAPEERALDGDSLEDEALWDGGLDALVPPPREFRGESLAAPGRALGASLGGARPPLSDRRGRNDLRVVWEVRMHRASRGTVRLSGRVSDVGRRMSEGHDRPERIFFLFLEIAFCGIIEIHSYKTCMNV